MQANIAKSSGYCTNSLLWIVFVEQARVKPAGEKMK